MTSEGKEKPHQQILSKWNLKSKTFLVTGGTKGIGLATSRSLLAHGASVLLCARSKSDVAKVVETLRAEFCEEGEASKKVIGFACDIATEEGRATLVSGTKSECGDSLDGLVNNVGVNDLEGMLKKAGAKGGATVVNVASAAGVSSTGTGAAYGMSKGAMIQFTKILACEWAKFNIRVNAVAPWMTMTPMLKDAVKADPSSLDKVKEWTPMHRLCSAEEAAGPITFLCMPCSSYVTGQCISADGGVSAQSFDGPCVTP